MLTEVPNSVVGMGHGKRGRVNCIPSSCIAKIDCAVWVCNWEVGNIGVSSRIDVLTKDASCNCWSRSLRKELWKLG